ncbi:2,4-dienoyl-CoA reductase-like NADH-dependent reductase (Old Yellow Enzyme family) [Enterobacter sp. BIGb0383]|uniref:alkene reductase n=1 Tax=unclassified Enterobacter TaxID=2608935 RepID=UPI000F46D594|nr:MULTISPECIES: alkene reductase [unclassified Enterobacter]ROP62039.1 2,4-dienoyl-CoA reductase-like NADH-dependent reductase (Old Yellow Enzyme family) [Enterobacter sp. BIGb0383]ROS12200.1 2,4-dienoyl-CoA reductase-like NADH-dependent reductase (Old Yellow Enzyme family) [Enterobacter sp. BIGb0359]
MDKLFTPVKVGDTTLHNRIVMAPMTRSRATVGDTADALTAKYYQQRASAGLIITEGSQISVQGQGYLFTPGIYNDEQVKGWELSTKAVHDAGGKIYVQLWHVGRISHPSLQKDGQLPVSSVPVKAQNATCYARNENGEPGPVPVPTPRALSIAEIQDVVQDYVRAAKNAIRAGFDGVEIHAANGYLLEQFINGGLNVRTDQYGGINPENRLRFVLEVTDAISQSIGAEKTGIRLAPFGRLFDMHAFEGEEETWLLLADKLSKRSLAYVHLSDQKTLGEQAIPDGFIDTFRAAYSGTLIVAGGFDKSRAESYLQQGKTDLIGFGRPYIANPDLAERLANDWPLNEVNRATMYGGDETGYTDYPFWSDTPGNTE